MDISCTVLIVAFLIKQELHNQVINNQVLRKIINNQVLRKIKIAVENDVKNWAYISLR